MLYATSPITLHIIHYVVNSIAALDLNNFFLVDLGQSAVEVDIHLNGLGACEQKAILRYIFPQDHAFLDYASLELDEGIGPWK